jgi:hypothetical protein
MAQAPASSPAGKATYQDRAVPSPPAVASVPPSGLNAAAAADPPPGRRRPQLNAVTGHGQRRAVRAEGEPGHRVMAGDRPADEPPGQGVPEPDRAPFTADRDDPAAGAERDRRGPAGRGQ